MYWFPPDVFSSSIIYSPRRREAKENNDGSRDPVCQPVCCSEDLKSQGLSKVVDISGSYPAASSKIEYPRSSPAIDPFFRLAKRIEFNLRRGTCVGTREAPEANRGGWKEEVLVRNFSVSASVTICPECVTLNLSTRGNSVEGSVGTAFPDSFLPSPLSAAGSVELCNLRITCWGRSQLCLEVHWTRFVLHVTSFSLPGAVLSEGLSRL